LSFFALQPTRHLKMRENIYYLQGCFPTSVYLRFGPRVVPFSGFYFEVAVRIFLQHVSKFLTDYTTSQPTENVSYIYCFGDFKYRIKRDVT
jgi:hypothetical protein